MNSKVYEFQGKQMSFIDKFVPSRICVHLAMLPPRVWAELQAEDFTVQRNSKNGGPKSGEPGAPEEKGWRIQQKSHSNCCGPGYMCGGGATFCSEDPSSIEELGDAVASKLSNMGMDKIPRWSVFMNNGTYSDTHACGWRVCDPERRTFWPTRCSSLKEKQMWWAWFDKQLDTLPLWSDVLAKRLSEKQRLPVIKEEEEIPGYVPPLVWPYESASLLRQKGKSKN
jgi:hypothetical protein